ncbi:serine hydrolase [Paenibacillus agilis]|uniref:Serine hydrolase n=1 Tax=Paenibacillus agilis TaxID=3020863 RepID=A0A559IPP8_9BACL|nr:serine hydrolase [Paenibacillus agilis]TVX89611.1 serine hydrolase [Paenibacillus agilis]
MKRFKCSILLVTTSLLLQLAGSVAVLAAEDRTHQESVTSLVARIKSMDPFRMISGISTTAFGAVHMETAFAGEPSAAPLTVQTVQSFADDFFSREEVKQQMAGAVAVVVKDGEVLLQKGYGFADVAKKKPVDPVQTVFSIASVSKIVTATAVMQHVEQGSIDLNTDIHRYMGQAKVHRKMGDPLTMKHLLTHSSGVKYADVDILGAKSAKSGQHYPLKDHVMRNEVFVEYKPGEIHSYDNFASMLQGYIVQEQSGLLFEDYVDKHIFQPLGMNNSSFVLTPKLKGLKALGYDGDGQLIPDMLLKPTVLPEGGMVSTGADMAKFLLAKLNGGELDGQRILQPETVKQMLTPQLSIHPDIPNMSYGYEYLAPHIFHGRNVPIKGGAMLNYSALVMMIPDENVGIFLGFNRSNGLTMAFAEQFMDQFYPDTRPKPVFKTPSLQELRKYEGLYRDYRIGILLTKVKANADGTLSVSDSIGTSAKYRQVDPMLFLNERGEALVFKEKEGQITYAQTFMNGNGWAGKLSQPRVYPDLPKQHPYRKYADGISSMINVGHRWSSYFHSTKPLTRAQFIKHLVDFTETGYSPNKSIFKDIKFHSYEKEIQTAVDLDLINLNYYKNGQFKPDQVITRQEAADIIWRLYRMPKVEVKLSGKTDKWAQEAVSFVVARGFFGPEVKPDKTGAFNYLSTKPLLTQEAAALFYKIALPLE